MSRNRDIDIVARTIYGEARNQSTEGMVAVANVVINRADDVKSRWPRTPELVCLQKLQFSCWNENDPNSKIIKNVGANSPIFVKCSLIAELAVDGFLKDITYGANHYHTKAIHPKWADETKIRATIGDHVFYKL